MKGLHIHESHAFFEYVRVNGSVPAAERGYVDVALLDMNHLWPNLGHDSLVHIVLETADSLREQLGDRKVRVLSFDVRYRDQVPEPGRFRIHIGTGGPGHLDPRLNDGESEWS